MTPKEVEAGRLQPVVSTAGLGRRFGAEWALAHVDLEVERGQVVLLAGSNGSGKTTLLRILAGLSLPTKGTVSVLGWDPWKERLDCRRELSFVAHEGYLYPPLTARETLVLWSRLLGSEVSREKQNDLLEEVGLAASADQQVAGFSAGMQKRLSLLRTRLEHPRLVLLDEPFSALDQEGRRLVSDWIDAFRRDGVAVIFASHVLDLAADLADRAVLLDAGQVAWSGAAAGLGARLSF